LWLKKLGLPACIEVDDWKKRQQGNGQQAKRLLLFTVRFSLFIHILQHKCATQRQLHNGSSAGYIILKNIAAGHDLYLQTI